MKTESRFTDEYSKTFWKRQHGMLKCKVCNKKLKRLPSNLVSQEIINGKIRMMYWSESTSYSGLDIIDKHINCVGKSNHTHIVRGENKMKQKTKRQIEINELDKEIKLEEMEPEQPEWEDESYK